VNIQDDFCSSANVALLPLKEYYADGAESHAETTSPLNHPQKEEL